MTTTPQLSIQPEDGVPKARPSKAKGRARNPQIEQYIKTLCDMRIGQSCFFPGLSRADLEFLRRPAVTAGIGLTIREVARDEIHLTQGVRVWRDYGEYDEL